MAVELFIADGDNFSWNTELIREAPDDLTKLQVFPDTLETLRAIRKMRIHLALVTMGNRMVQWQKARILGLDKVFTTCIYCERPQEKGLNFAKLVRRYATAPGNVIVGGDRPDNEIFYGNELGCVTVRMLYGKYAEVEPADSSQKPTYEIRTLGELLPIISSLNS
jgi:putative hydrolase of the HAD superfamily